ARAEVDEEVRRARLAAVQARIKSAASSGDSEALNQAKEEFLRLKAEPTTCLSERRYVINDATIEKVGEILIGKPRGILLNRDELVGWFSSFQRSGREIDRAFYLESWNGTGSFNVDRIGRGSIHVPALTISILGGIQPDRLRSLFSGAMADGGEADGL